MGTEKKNKLLFDVSIVDEFPMQLSLGAKLRHIYDGWMGEGLGGKT